MVGAVLWGLDDRSTSGPNDFNEVSRSEPATLSLQPALVQSGVVLSEPVNVAPTPAPVVAALEVEVAQIPPVRPVARPANLRPQVPAVVPVPAAPKPAAVLTTPPAPKAAVKDDAVTVMSYGIIGAFQAQGAAMTGTPVQVTPTPEPVARIRALADEQTAAAEAPKAIVRTYTVKEGDSLPGIAFRFYGTTVAYLQILNANPDVLADPGELRAGMVLRVPETN